MIAGRDEFTRATFTAARAALAQQRSDEGQGQRAFAQPGRPGDQVRVAQTPIVNVALESSHCPVVADKSPAANHFFSYLNVLIGVELPATLRHAASPWANG